MTDHPIFDCVELLRTARKAEADCALALADARASVERTKAIALAEGYQSGQVDGKNAETRKVQEAQLLDGSQPVREAETLERQLETKHTAARIERSYQDDRYRAMLTLMTIKAIPTLVIQAEE